MITNAGPGGQRSLEMGAMLAERTGFTA